jgi:SAM-dependent methyltransferase
LRGSDPNCVICAAVARGFARVEGRDYWRCDACEATFLDPAQRPAPAEERAHYALHENDASAPAYRRFLARIADPLLERLPPRRQGLDYGCGPGPALACMLREAGHDVRIYDPLFVPDAEALRVRYDFITCTETAEHFHHPATEFQRLGRMLRPGGWLAVMTCFQTDDARFAQWHYRRDPTHVVFYRAATFHRIAAQYGWRCEIPSKDVALMQIPRVEASEREAR